MIDTIRKIAEKQNQFSKPLMDLFRIQVKTTKGFSSDDPNIDLILKIAVVHHLPTMKSCSWFP